MEPSESSEEDISLTPVFSSPRVKNRDGRPKKKSRKSHVSSVCECAYKGNFTPEGLGYIKGAMKINLHKKDGSFFTMLGASSKFIGTKRPESWKCTSTSSRTAIFSGSKEQSKTAISERH